MNQLLGVQARLDKNGLKIEVTDTGYVSYEFNNEPQEVIPKILYTIAQQFKYGHNFIIHIFSQDITLHENHIAFYKYKLDPVTLTISSYNKSINYSGKSSFSLLNIRTDDIDITFQKISAVTNPKFNSYIHGTSTEQIDHTCQADFHHCKACPFRSQVINCILGHSIKVA